MRINENNGFTLVEILIAVLILSVGIVSVLLFFSTAIITGEFAGDLTVAATHAEHIFEEMESRKTLANIIGTNWADWAQEQGLNTLPYEVCDIRFTNAESNPLEIQATVNWTKNSRANHVTLITTLLK